MCGAFKTVTICYSTASSLDFLGKIENNEMTIFFPLQS